MNDMNTQMKWPGLCLLLVLSLASCKKNESLETMVPNASQIEVGLSNNEMGTIGKDFHFNAEILAGDKIETVQISILPKTGETYASAWRYVLSWDNYKGAKNASVHKHFNIPADAVEGKYDFVITVFDQNGTKLEIRRSVTLYLEANLPVNPQVSIFNVFVNDGRFYRNGQFTNASARVKSGDILQSQITISGVKGSGKMYVLLINSKEKHRPESVSQIDFSKAIVYDVVEHQNWTTNDHFSNVTIDPVSFQTLRNYPSMTIGANLDHHLPTPNPITGAKAWATGTYYFGVVYHNSTYNSAYYQYIDIPIDIN